MTSLPWTYRPLIGLDFETSGLNVDHDRIVTAAVVRWGGGKPTHVHRWMSNLDGAEISAAAERIHGISTEQAHAEGRPAHTVVGEIVDALTGYVAEGWPIVVMNAPFDLTMLERECARYAVRSVWDATPVVLDPRVLDRYLDRYRPGKRTLSHLCSHYAVQMDGGAHTAEVDAKAACAVTHKIGRRYEHIGTADLGELHEMQAIWARDLHDDFLAWQQRKSGTYDQAPFDWPFISAPAGAGT